MSWGIVASVGGAVLGSAISADAAGDAADTQAAATDRATRLQKEMFDKQVELQAPFREAGLTANNKLMYMLGLGGTSSGTGTPDDLDTWARANGYTMPVGRGWTTEERANLDPYYQKYVTDFKADQQQSIDPNDPEYGSLMRRFGMADFEADPGYQFRMDEGMRGVEGSAAARGGLLSGAAMKAIQKYGQGLASQEYGNAYNRFTSDQTNQYNRLAGIVNTGQGATNQVSNAAGQFGQQAGSNIIGAGNAQASGIVGGANALTGGINQGFNMYQQNELMKKIQSARPVSLWGPPSGGSGVWEY